jgi:hypothetical protein
MGMADYQLIFDGRDTFIVEIISQRAPLANSRLFDGSGSPGTPKRTKNLTAATSSLAWRCGIAGATIMVMHRLLAKSNTPRGATGTPRSPANPSAPISQVFFWSAHTAQSPTMSAWCPGAELNHRHCDFQSHALPTELPGHPGRAACLRRDGRRSQPIQYATGPIKQRREAMTAGRHPARRTGPGCDTAR